MSSSDQKVTYQLSFRDVIRILRLVDLSPYRELQVEVGDLKLRVMREQPGEATAESTRAKTGQVEDAPETVRESPTEPVARPAPPPTRAVTDGIPVTAPLAGTFYRSPYPGEPAFVEVGSAVNKGDVVGILEIMKLMNYVVAPCPGVVREICAENAAFVEYGQVLAVIEPVSGS